MASIIRANILRLSRTPVQSFVSSRRCLSTPAQRDAFLEPVAKHPGIVSLALNRPQARNAISINLLKVRRNPHVPMRTAAHAYRLSK